MLQFPLCFCVNLLLILANLLIIFVYIFSEVAKVTRP